MTSDIPLQENVPISLNFRDINIKIAERQILENVSGKVKPGQILAIMGPSGEFSYLKLVVLFWFMEYCCYITVLNSSVDIGMLKKKRFRK